MAPGLYLSGVPSSPGVATPGLGTCGDRKRYALSSGRARLQEPLRLEPLGAALRPGRAGAVTRTQAEAMTARGIDMQLGGDAGLLQGQEHPHAILARNGVVPGVGEEGLR